MTKGLNAGLLRKYKSEWEGLVLRRRRQGQISAQKKETSSDKSRLRFEIKRIAYDIAGTPSKAELNRSLGYLYNWSLIEGLHKEIVEALGLTHWFCNEWQIKELARRIYELFWHFIGPTRVPMNAKDEKEIIMGVELLGDLGGQVAILGFRSEVMKAVVDSLLRFNEIGDWYKRPKIRRCVSKTLKMIEKDCEHALGDPEYKMAIKTKLQTSLRYVQRGNKVIKKGPPYPPLPDW